MVTPTNRYTLGDAITGTIYWILDDGNDTKASATIKAIRNIHNDCEITGGVFLGGNFYGGIFHRGSFYDGDFYDGEFYDGIYTSGEFYGGVMSYQPVMNYQLNGGCYPVNCRTIFELHVTGLHREVYAV